MNQHPTFVKTNFCAKNQKTNFRTKVSWKLSEGLLLGSIPNSQANKELFKIVDSSLRKSNLSAEEWKGMAMLAEDRSILVSESR